MKTSCQLFAVLAAASLLLPLPARTAPSPDAPARDKPLVLTTIFPLLDFARTIAGDDLRVESILPVGAEPHSYSPAPSDLLRIRSAAAFLYASEELESWTLPLLADAPSSLRVLAAAPLPPDSDDPHVWLDPLLSLDIATRIQTLFSALLPEAAPRFAARADALRADLRALHEDYASALAPFAGRTLLFAGHFAFGHLAARYRLLPASPYPGFAPDATPSPRALASMVRLMRSTGASALFYEEIDPRVARVLAAETGARLLPLHSLHNLSSADLADPSAPPTYFSLMRQNLSRLRQGLETP